MLAQQTAERGISISKWLLISFILAAIGLYGIVEVFLVGQEEAYGITREVPWGMLIISYSFFVAISVGLAVIVALAHVFHFESFNIMSKRVALLSLAALIGAFYLIFWDLAGPFQLQVLRFVKYFFNFEITSPIWWMAAFYMIELPLLALEFYLLTQIKKSEKFAFYAGVTGFFIGIIAYSTLSFVFAANSTRPLWHSALFPLFFIISAIGAGASVVLLMIYFGEKSRRAISALSKMLFFVLLIMLFANIWNIFISQYGVTTDLTQSIAVLTSGQLSTNFYLFELGLGIIIPVALLVIGRFESITLSATAALLAIIGVFFSRYDNIIGGQLVQRQDPMMPEYLNLSYTPSLSEISIFISATGVVGIVYFLGEKFFNLNEEVSHEKQ